MDSVFFLDEEARAVFIRTVVRTLGYAYICLWSYVSDPLKCLVYTDGWYNDDSGQPSSSSAPSFPQRLFQAYQRSIFGLESSFPGLAFKEGISYIELPEPASVASMEAQRQFYQGAGIKTAVFMGCRSGEIEIGTSSSSNINMEMEIRNLFTGETIGPRLADHSKASTSSSSLRSVSVGSPEYSSLLSSIYSPDPLHGSSSEQNVINTPRPSFSRAAMPTTTTIPPHQRPYSRFSNIPLPSSSSDDVEMAKAMLTVISSPLLPSSSYQPRQIQTQTRRPTSAFKRYTSALTPTLERRSTSQSQHLLKLSITRLRSIYNRSRREPSDLHETRPTSSQLHHMISERKRREKLNESFEILRSLLPPGSKKDKASVLLNTREYLSALKADVLELKEKNRLLLESRFVKQREEIGIESSRRVHIESIEVPESTTAEGEREIEVRVAVRGEFELTNLLLQLLECIKRMVGIKLLSMDAESQVQQTDQTNNIIILRLKIKARQCDKSSFEEALTRAVDDMAS